MIFAFAENVLPRDWSGKSDDYQLVLSAGYVNKRVITNRRVKSGVVPRIERQLEPPSNLSSYIFLNFVFFRRKL